jgi:TRAP-type uncharacterized transport system substrate-binding protein
MGGLAAGIYAKVVAAILCLIAAIWLLLWYFIPAPPSVISIASGVKNGVFEHIANRYRERLAAAHVTLDVRATDGVIQSLDLVKDRNSGVDAALIFGGITNSKESPELLSLGRIEYAPYWLFYGGARLDRLTQLKGKRVAAGIASRRVTSQILSAYGVTADNTALLPLIGPVATNAVKTGEVDALFLPLDLHAPQVQSLLHDPAIQLMNIPQAEALTRLFPYLTRLTLPEGVIDLERNIPVRDVNLIATTNVVVVHKDLHPELIYLLAQTLKEEHSGAGIFHRAGDFPTPTDPELVMADGAQDFYRNGPSLLQRYLPFWMINVTKRMIAVFLTAVAVIVPLMNYAPKLYQSFVHAYVAKLYRRLRVLEAELQAEPTAPRMATMQADLENIDRAAKTLPMRHSDLFFSLRVHIDLVRARLASLTDVPPIGLRNAAE